MPNHRLLAESLRGMKREREQQLERERLEQERSLADAEERARRELDSVERQREELRKKVAKQNEELTRLDREATDEWRRVQEQAEWDAAQRRVIELAGNDNESLRERLMKEGFQEGLVIDTLKRRTLEQSLERPTGLRARFVERDDNNALERLTQDLVRADDLRNREVLHAMRDLREQAVNKGYLSPDQREQVDRALYLTEKFQENDFYKKQDEHDYFTQIHDLAQGIRRDLGLDPQTSTLTYHNKKF